MAARSFTTSILQNRDNTSASEALLIRRVHASVVLLVLFAGAADAQQRAVANREDLNTFTRNYYRHPQPELVSQAISVLGTSGFLDNANRVPPTVAFFGEIFGANPQRLPEWRELIAKQDQRTREALEAALEVGSGPGVLGFTDVAAWMNDMYWGAFFASGRKEYLDKLIETTAHWENRTDRDLFLTGATALWSLAGNGRTHERVREAIEAARKDADPVTSARLALALADPAAIRDKMREVMAQQAAAGKW
jgi:hypothetical protein